MRRVRVVTRARAVTRPSEPVRTDEGRCGREGGVQGSVQRTRLQLLSGQARRTVTCSIPTITMRAEHAMLSNRLGTAAALNARAARVRASTINRFHSTHRIVRQRAPAVETRNSVSPTPSDTEIWIDQ